MIKVQITSEEKKRCFDFASLIINDCILFGYIERSVLEQQPTKSFGEGPCKSYALSDLKPISQLIEGFTP